MPQNIIKKVITLEDNQRISAFIFISPNFIICYVHQEQQLLIRSSGIITTEETDSEGDNDEIDEYCNLKLDYYWQNDSWDNQTLDNADASFFDLLCLDCGNQFSADADEQVYLVSKEEKNCDKIYTQGKYDTTNNQVVLTAEKEDLYTESSCMGNLIQQEYNNSENCIDSVDLVTLTTYQRQRLHSEPDTHGGTSQHMEEREDDLNASYSQLCADQFHPSIETGLWGNLYCSCGLLKCYCDFHRLLSEDQDHLPNNLFTPYYHFGEANQVSEHAADQFYTSNRTGLWGNLYCTCGLLKYYCETHTLQSEYQEFGLNETYNDMTPSYHGLTHPDIVGNYTRYDLYLAETAAEQDRGLYGHHHFMISNTNQYIFQHHADNFIDNCYLERCCEECKCYEEPNLWGNSYCSCGLLKWYCEIHRMQQEIH